MGFPGGSVVKEYACNAGDAGDIGLIPGSETSPGEGHGNPFQYSCLENPMDRGAWWTAVHRVIESEVTEHACTSFVCGFVYFYGFIYFYMGSYIYIGCIYWYCHIWNKNWGTLKIFGGTSLAVQWLRLHASTAGGTGTIPGQRTGILLKKNN